MLYKQYWLDLLRINNWMYQYIIKSEVLILAIIYIWSNPVTKKNNKKIESKDISDFDNVIKYF